MSRIAKSAVARECLACFNCTLEKLTSARGAPLDSQFYSDHQHLSYLVRNPTMDPWGDRFAGAKDVRETTVRADCKPERGLIELTVIDTAPVICNLAPSIILVLPHQLDFDKLAAACKETLVQYPELAGR